MKLKESDVTQQVKDFLEYRGWRAIRLNRGLMQGAFGGVVQFGEPGMADFLFIRYMQGNLEAGPALTLWVEFKAPGRRAQCRCQSKRPRQRCTACDQAKWREQERRRGALVWLVDDLDQFGAEYRRVFGWLHSGDAARGQSELQLVEAVRLS